MWAHGMHVLQRRQRQRHISSTHVGDFLVLSGRRIRLGWYAAGLDALITPHSALAGDMSRSASPSTGWCGRAGLPECGSGRPASQSADECACQGAAAPPLGTEPLPLPAPRLQSRWPAGALACALCRYPRMNSIRSPTRGLPCGASPSRRGRAGCPAQHPARADPLAQLWQCSWSLPPPLPPNLLADGEHPPE